MPPPEPRSSWHEVELSLRILSVTVIVPQLAMPPPNHRYIHRVVLPRSVLPVTIIVPALKMPPPKQDELSLSVQSATNAAPLVQDGAAKSGLEILNGHTGQGHNPAIPYGKDAVAVFPVYHRQVCALALKRDRATDGDAFVERAGPQVDGLTRGVIHRRLDGGMVARYCANSLRLGTGRRPSGKERERHREDDRWSGIIESFHLETSSGSFVLIGLSHTRSRLDQSMRPQDRQS